MSTQVMQLIPKPVSKSITYRVWYYPEPGCFYSIGFDPAGATEGGSQGVARVWQDRPRKLCAEAAGNAIEEIWAEELWKFGTSYNNAYINIEIFRYGRTTLSMLISGSTTYNVRPYPNIYHEPSTVHLKMGIHAPSGAHGWSADSLRRPIMLSFAREMIGHSKEFPHSMEDAAVLHECANFRDLGDGPRAIPGERDDRIIADALAWLMLKQNLFRYKTEQQIQRDKPMFSIDKDEIMFNPTGVYKKRQPERQEQRLFV